MRGIFQTDIMWVDEGLRETMHLMRVAFHHELLSLGRLVPR
jgi:hypothetical protein